MTASLQEGGGRRAAAGCSGGAAVCCSAIGGLSYIPRWKKKGGLPKDSRKRFHILRHLREETLPLFFNLSVKCQCPFTTCTDFCSLLVAGTLIRENYLQLVGPSV